MKKIKRKGFTSIELLIVVGMISALSSLVYFLYDTVSDKLQVASEIKNVETLIGKLKSATIASTYKNIKKDNLIDYGITYDSEFYSFDINGVNDKSFEIKYKDLNSRQCSDFALKTASFKGEYILSRLVNNKEVTNTPKEISSECSKPLNEIKFVFSGLIVPQVVQIAKGANKPAQQFAQPGTFVPELPARGDVPVNLNKAFKLITDIPVAPVKGSYTPPSYIKDNPQIIVGGDVFDTGGYVKPVYEDDPPPPVASGEDDTDFKPEAPPPPPPPPALPKPEDTIGVAVDRYDSDNYSRWAFFCDKDDDTKKCQLTVSFYWDGQLEGNFNYYGIMTDLENDKRCTQITIYEFCQDTMKNYSRDEIPDEYGRETGLSTVVRTRLF